MMLYSFMKFMISIIDALLALHIVSAQGRGCAKRGKRREGGCGQDGLPKIIAPAMWQVHLLFSPCEEVLDTERMVIPLFGLYSDVPTGLGAM
jgi:hypothetical protein